MHKNLRKKRILIYYDVDTFGMTDFRNVDYESIPAIVKSQYNGSFPNIGNKVWLQAIVSLLSTDETECVFGYESISEDQINSEYDCVVMPMANCFHAGWIKYMKRRTERLKKIKKPVFVIASGVQADSYDDLDDLICSIKEPASEFIKSVYNTGGEWALRGYFTKEFFDKLGFRSSVVTGCPSLFQTGKALCISNEKVDRKEFKAAINGSFKLPLRKKDIDKSDFICQGNYGMALYDPDHFSESDYSLRRICKLARRGDYPSVKALAEGRIQLFPDLQEWMDYYVNCNVSFAFGSRIHGTVMPILSGVPALLFSCDARTREIAEYFDIPMIRPDKSDDKRYDLYELYLNTDYSRFNANFSKKFEAFEKFLIDRDVVRKINPDNLFFKRRNIEFNKVYPNDRSLRVLKKKLAIYRPLTKAVETYYK